MILESVDNLVVVSRSPIGQWEPYVVVDAETRLWFAKAMRSNAILAEAIWYGLGCVVGAAQPRGAVGDVGGERVWLSRAVPGALHWHESASARIANIAGLAAAVAIDAVLGNEDRHEENVLLSPRSDDKFDIWFIDGEGAGAVQPTRIGQWPTTRVTDPSQLPHVRGLPIDALLAPAAAAAAVLADIGGQSLDEIAQRAFAASGVREEWLAKVQAVIRARCGRAPALTADYLARLARL